MVLHGAKQIRDRAIAELARSMMGSEIYRLTVADVDQSGVTLVRGTPTQVIELDGAQRDAVNRWLFIRRMVGGLDNSLFVSLHWTDAHKQPGSQLSYDSIRRCVRGGCRAARRNARLQESQNRNASREN
jgi:site-specific recombinase XerC